MTRYDVNITRKALKELYKLDPYSRNRILEALIILRDYGFTNRLDIKKLRAIKVITGLERENTVILFELEKPRKIIVYAILPRKEAYK